MLSYPQQNIEDRDITIKKKIKSLYSATNRLFDTPKSACYTKFKFTNTSLIKEAII